ncbi:hypothetical protein E3P92_01041 [Wallemia ichthyophaga]|uniref:Heat shock factor-binding protein 1 n=2 Tax=Wallemia ichthyophaga TaxID=245174 RepID=R9AR13_WALI9|nr:uncharacterized protein J056_000421 [Wallemia ichthyophaga EXF-994]XP_009266097.1 uncharacterized protein J056_000424 [Wallemia ichthyophaga EXF-994]TIA72677.1 hypothetical protein E3P91_01912 [Wallemia ichthyophaga]EOR04666.1 hypothetical protein J056_000421 [Wallemia ichthyophaga EXF-994]EOR04669.1 hypothetical protein J056_000424 [Wallemia ichthyophaga EXF-994]TIA79521.1 hypothetical protein E3P98_03245 [Wallemia ichthyophaga]TIA92991.1 hypothetical protein E3P97_01170 [Wallemia ichthyo
MSTLKPAAPLSTRNSSPVKKGDDGDISSPHELTAFVEDVLNKLDTKFDTMSGVVLEKMDEMADRVDSLENSIQGLVNSAGTLSPRPSSPRSPRI